MTETPGVFDIHGREKRQKRIYEMLSESDILDENKRLIRDYVKYRTVESGLSPLRQEKIISNLMVFAGFLGKSFKEADKADIQRIIEAVYTMPSNKRKGENLADSTKSAYCKILKSFFCWLKSSEHPEETAWLKPPNYEPKKLSKSDKLFWEDVEKLSRASMNKRDFLLPQLLFDTGARIEELLTLRIKDVELLGVNGANCESGKPRFAAKVHIQKSKTETRSPMVYKCVPALIDWLDNHPFRDNPEAPLFVHLQKNKNAMSYKDARVTLVKMADRAGLKKRVNPHVFRKSACSHCGDIGMGDSQIDKRFGWKIGSRVKRAYLFPDEDRANEVYLNGEGAIIEKKDPAKEGPKPTLCWWCNKPNPIGRDFCVNPECRLPLNPSEAVVGGEKKIRAMVMNVLHEFMQDRDVAKNFEKFVGI